jgi:hypothetical protein
MLSSEHHLSFLEVRGHVVAEATLVDLFDRDAATELMVKRLVYFRVHALAHANLRELLVRK